MKICALFALLVQASPQDGIENIFRTMERLLRHQAAEGISLCLQTGFVGTGLLAPPPSVSKKEKFGSVTVETWKEKEPARADSVVTLNAFFRDVASVTDVRIKLLRLEEKKGSFRMDLTGIRPSGGRFHRTEEYRAEWEKSPDSRWLFSGWIRISGQSVESLRPLFQDRSESLG